jgi:hypothetical protein
MVNEPLLPLIFVRRSSNAHFKATLWGFPTPSSVIQEFREEPGYGAFLSCALQVLRRVRDHIRAYPFERPWQEVTIRLYTTEELSEPTFEKLCSMARQLPHDITIIHVPPLILQADA